METNVLSIISVPDDMPKLKKDDVHILTGTDGVLESLFGCRHQWGFPRTSPDMKQHYEKPFNSHQTCTVCGRQRFFNFDTMKIGPMFRKRVK